MPSHHLPMIDISPLRSAHASHEQILEVVREIKQACETLGFFYIKGHGVHQSLERQLERVAQSFFDQPIEEKQAFTMDKGGKAWRGWFPLGGELTSGSPDEKEGIYFGEELSPAHPLVQKHTPMHGPNLFPNPIMKEVVIDWMTQMTHLGHLLMKGVALSLDLPSDYFSEGCMKDPLILFRMFHYPRTDKKMHWGVGEHTDYGVLTILKQDQVGGLQVKAGGSHEGDWIDAPPIEGTFVINLGDMLERMTGGRYLSTPHRVKNSSDRSRYSFPFFFDPNFFSPIQHIVATEGLVYDSLQRWDRENIHEGEIRYGEYLLKKVGRVFPALSQQVNE